MRWLYVLATSLLLQACGGGDSSEEALSGQDCSVAGQRQSLRAFMQEQYYWYRNLGAPDESARTMDAYFQSMLYKPVDRFSFTEPTAAFNQVFAEGRRVGFGYVLVWTDADRTTARVRNVEPLSPVARAGLRRGDTVLAIDGYAPAELAAGALPVVTTPGAGRVFTVVTATGERRELAATSGEYALSPVVATSTFEVMRATGPAKVGYLAYSQFVSYSQDDLRVAFAGFAQAGVSDVILDLRYNGGGSVAVAVDLASMAGGPATAGKVFTSLRFNDRQPGNERSLYFNSYLSNRYIGPSAQAQRVFVITSGATASASELVINGLRPFAQVVLVGETTYGKPYGFTPRAACGISYQAVQFETVNAEGVGGFTAGFQPDCQVADDLDHALGDAQEGRIRTALTYAATGRCGADAAPARQAAAQRRQPAPAFGETLPERMFLE